MPPINSMVADRLTQTAAYVELFCGADAGMGVSIIDPVAGSYVFNTFVLTDPSAPAFPPKI